MTTWLKNSNATQPNISQKRRRTISRFVIPAEHRIKRLSKLRVALLVDATSIHPDSVIAVRLRERATVSDLHETSGSCSLPILKH